MIDNNKFGVVCSLEKCDDKHQRFKTIYRGLPTIPGGKVCLSNSILNMIVLNYSLYRWIFNVATRCIYL